jgi:rubrerythrin
MTLQPDGDDVPEQIRSMIASLDDQLTTRRSVLAGTGAALGGAAFVGSSAASDEGGDEDEGMEMGSSGPAGRSDADVLNFALALEHLETAFYRDLTPSEETLRESETLEPFGDEIVRNVREYTLLAGEHEATHVEVLETVIELLGAEPVSEAEYEFGVRGSDGIDPNAFLETAALLENTGVTAYAGAVNRIDSPDIQRAAATIATVEARHATYFNLITSEIPYPAAFDEATPQSEILEAASGFIVDSEDMDD